jgi:hypothetical protein
MDRLDVMEREADRIMGHRVQTIDLLKERAHKLAVFQFAAASASVAFAVSLWEKRLPLGVVAAVLVLAAGWYATGALVVWRCMAPLPLPPVGNEPQALFAAPSTVDADEMRRGCLRVLQDTQAAFADRSNTIAQWLSKGYYAALLIVPSVAALVAFLAGQV